MANKRWLDRHPILSEKDVPELETAAAIEEFQHRLPRGAAEAAAHAAYVKRQAVAAAAHHLVGARMAHAGGHPAAAMAHGQAYAAAVRAAGFDPLAPPPKEVHDALRAEPPDYYKFVGHPADGLFAPVLVAPDAGDDKMQQLLNSLEEMKARLKPAPQQPGPAKTP